MDGLGHVLIHALGHVGGCRVGSFAPNLKSSKVTAAQPGLWHRTPFDWRACCRIRTELVASDLLMEDTGWKAPRSCSLRAEGIECVRAPSRLSVCEGSRRCVPV